jgi:hypothetical protein
MAYKYTAYTGKDALAVIEKLDDISGQLLSPSEKQDVKTKRKQLRKLYWLCGSIKVLPPPPEMFADVDGTSPQPALQHSMDEEVEAGIVRLGSREAYGAELSEEFNALKTWVEELEQTVQQRFDQLFGN